MKWSGPAARGVGPDDIRRPLPAAVEVAGVLYYMTGGFMGPLPFMRTLQTVQVARELPSANNLRQVGMAGPSAVEAPAPVAPKPATSAAEKKIEAALASPLGWSSSRPRCRTSSITSRTIMGSKFKSTTKRRGMLGSARTRPLRRASECFAPLGPSHDARELNLTYVIQDEVLLIPPPRRPRADWRPRRTRWAIWSSVRRVGDGQADFDSLIDLITSTVRPTTWDSVGGPGSIAPFETGLSIVVSQTEEAHCRISRKRSKIAQGHARIGAKGLPALRHRPKSEAGKESGTGGMMGGMGGMGGAVGGLGGARVRLVRVDGGKDQKGGSGAAKVKLSEASKTKSAPQPAKKQPAGRFAYDPFAAPVESAGSEPAKSGSKKALHPTGQLKTPIVTSVIPANQSLIGMRSLKIDVVQTPAEAERVLTFRSLGVEPQLTVTLVNQSRMAVLAGDWRWRWDWPAWR